jgi:hypothetical protein
MVIFYCLLAIQSQDPLVIHVSIKLSQLRKDIPPMHAAKPALAIEHATTQVQTSAKIIAMNKQLTADLSLTPALRSRNCAAPLEKHTNCLHV